MSVCQKQDQVLQIIGCGVLIIGLYCFISNETCVKEVLCVRRGTNRVNRSIWIDLLPAGKEPVSRICLHDIHHRDIHTGDKPFNSLPPYVPFGKYLYINSGEIKVFYRL